jgi:hypothetical protein
VRFAANRWPPPAGLPAARCYHFGRAPSVNQGRAWLRAAREEADAEFRRRNPGQPVPAGGALLPLEDDVGPELDPALPVAEGGGRPPGAAGADAAVGAAHAAAAAATAGVAAPPVGMGWPGKPAAAPAPPPAPTPSGIGLIPPTEAWLDDVAVECGIYGEAPPGWTWALAEDVGDAVFGATVNVGPAHGVLLLHRAGRRGLLRLATGLNTFAVLLETWRVAVFRASWRGRDLRVLPLEVGADGEAQRSWHSVAAAVKEEPLPGFQLMPRTTAWCVRWLVREGGPVQHHETWRARKKLSQADFGVQEHHTLSTILVDLAATDQVDVVNILGAERLVRKLQLIEYFWDERQREQDANQLKMPPEEISAFMGGTGSAARPSSMVCPSMMDHIGRELERISNIKKNARKLREETKTAPPGEKPGGAKK